MIHRLCTYAAVVLFLVSSAAGAETEESRPQASWDDYEIVVDRNIFRRDRRPASRGPSRVVLPEAPPPAGRFIVLRGIAQQGDQHVAFFEQTRTGEVTRVRAGDTIADGQVAGITLDYVEFEKDGATVRVETGKNLEGRASAFSIPFGSYDSVELLAPAAGATAPTGGAPSAAEAAIMERLRQKRESELAR